ncbi:MAG: four-carbon acid sugar kinase family protein [Janthinobacterium lividum]
MNALRLLADDLTGALDTAAEFAAASPVATFWHGGLPASVPPSAAIDSGTRESTEDAARTVVAALAPLLTAGLTPRLTADEPGSIAFKKIDSLIRGQTLAELAACLPGWTRCVLAPAFPAQGRITRGGRQHARAEAGWQPVGPHLVTALRGMGLAAQPGVPGQPLPPGISVFDAEDDAALDAVAATARAEAVLWCGTGGLARALAHATAGRDAACSPLLPGPLLGLFGSDQPATFAQLRACAPYWTHLAEDSAHDLAARLQDGVALVSIDLPPGLPRAAAAARIGTALHGLARALPRPGTLLVAGGETLRGLCLALGASHLEVQGRILPGLPRAILRGGAWDGVTIVSKSGAFGPPGLFRDLLARNGFPANQHASAPHQGPAA